MSKSNKKSTKEAEQPELDQTAMASGQPQGAVSNESDEPSLEDKLSEEKDKFLRLFAEFENYKKRTTKERLDLFKTAGREVIASLLPVLDDFDRALPQIRKSGDEDTFKGIELIHHKLRDVLKSKGLNEISVEVGADFDSEVHEAITQIPAPEEKLKGKVIDTVEKGYSLGEIIIRHPKVVVGQ